MLSPFALNTLTRLTVLRAIAWSAKSTSIAGEKGSAVAKLPTTKPSVWTKLKFIHPLTLLLTPAIAFRSDIKPAVLVSQNISSKDSTGAVSKIPKCILYASL